VRILIATVQVPFVRGGAEILAEGLCDALRTAGHEAEIIAMPFKWYPPELIADCMLACRLISLTESNGTPVDRLIGLKFPAYLAPHPNKVLWLLHQHRQAYDLWDHPSGDLIRVPNGAAIRSMIQHADRRHIPEARKVFTIAENVSHRLKTHCGIDSTPLYHPPAHAELFYTAEGGDYFFFPSRINSVKRQRLALEALAKTRQPVQLRFAGTADQSEYLQQLRSLASELSVQDRVNWLGHVGEQEKRDLYAKSVGVIYPPEDEDYGYVTLEAMLASKPVITCTDSGGPLEFVQHRKTGLVAKPTPASLAQAMNILWEDRDRARQLGAKGRLQYDRLDITWSKVVESLLS
jgi:glycosyltransferase involved in cell wall biosynthesis